jgi:hypothetical protein
MRKYKSRGVERDTFDKIVREAIAIAVKLHIKAMEHKFSSAGKTDDDLGLSKPFNSDSVNYSNKYYSSGTGIDGLSDYEAEHYLATALMEYSPTGIIRVNRESQAIIVYSDTLKESPALQNIIRNSSGDSRQFYLVNKEHGILADEFLSGLDIDKNIFERHVFLQDTLTAEQLALQIAGFLYSNGIKQGRIFTGSQDDLAAWSKQGLIEALVMLLKDKRFEIVSDYSEQHIEYIRAYKQLLIAA